ncbi:hypothetical protein IFU40_02265 [Microbacterium sp. CFBP 13617]|uniref:hypothetical protein n=1 Tax=Microbacterium sp. CFBP 13617 TaxID=2774035 RepID=UPI0017871E52|nr:hypothetical protein [Microbacterium sp. CFBP 13617]MBD8217453.1 hypothetical protein [Microbacterium sp. CFBP 13617]
MTDNYPSVTTLTYTDFASVDCIVTRESALDGNSGSSSVQVKVHAGHIALDDEMVGIGDLQNFTIHLTGESEHAVLAKLFRNVAQVLDPE